MSDIDKMKQQTMFTAAGLLLGWSIFKVISKLSQTTEQKEVTKVTKETEEA